MNFLIKSNHIKTTSPYVLILWLIFYSFNASGQAPITFTNGKSIIIINNGLEVFEDVSGNLNADAVIQKDSFELIKSYPPNFGLSSSAFWLKLTLTNQTNLDEIILGISNPLIDEIELYEIVENRPVFINKQGDKFLYAERDYNHQHILFNIKTQNKPSTYLLRVKSWEQLITPLFISSPIYILEKNLTQDLLFGLFFGIMIVLIFYNLFIYISIKDISYLYYVTYIFLITLTQASINGYTLKFITPNSPYFSNISLILFNSLAGIAAIKFIQNFLDTKKLIPTLNKLYLVITTIYIGGIATILIGENQLSYKLMDLGGGLISFYSLFIAIKLMLKGSKPAKYFLAAWSVFLIGVILFVLKNSGILPSNDFTNHTLTFGIAIEGSLLSFALAARINIYKKEKEQSQKQAFLALEEKETLVREQNVMLENKVTERTLELNTTLNNLKETQSQLVDAEKMASLGQLTAGVAHEINNPINFVSSNISPLKQDINDLKTLIDKYSEIDSTNVTEKLKEIEALKKQLDYSFLTQELESIISSIENGANRTTEIVRSLRNFSRLDESDLIAADINEGIESALVLLRSEYAGIKIIKELAALPKIECYPGKLNQVFLNILNNAIQAIKGRKNQTVKGMITIATSEINDDISISIKDNGEGISKDIMDKIFNPFFTTKDVGKGTGLGLSIVYRIIESHNGTIKVESEENIGTTFTLILPKHQKQ